MRLGSRTRRLLRSWFVPLATTLILVGIPAAAVACSCIEFYGSNQACEQRWKHDAVFAGRVVSIDESPVVRAPTKIVRFAVAERFGGVTTTEIDIATPSSEAACGYSFVVGQSYLVYAYKAAGVR